MIQDLDFEAQGKVTTYYKDERDDHTALCQLEKDIPKETQQ